MAKELVKRGVEVEVFLGYNSPSQPKYGKSEVVDDVLVTTIPRIRNMLLDRRLCETDADVIHSQNDPLNTYFIFRNNPNVPKAVTIQDLRTPEERRSLTSDSPSIEWGMPRGRQILLSPFIWHYAKSNLKMANAVACHAHLLEPKIRNVLGFSKRIFFLPNFIDIPKSKPMTKSDKPSVVLLGRLDPVKNPELTIEVARKMPDVDFYILGLARAQGRNAWLHKQAQGITNLHFLGHDAGLLKEELLSKAWILINTSYYECMPVSFLEALAHKCCILSTQNPDGYTESFGYYDKSFSADGLVHGLRVLLQDNAWTAKAEAGFQWVRSLHSTERGIQNHIELYRKLAELKAR